MWYFTTEKEIACSLIVIYIEKNIQFIKDEKEKMKMKLICFANYTSRQTEKAEYCHI
jgi:hypothetical protein